MTQAEQELLNLLQLEEAQNEFQGWDFSYLEKTGRMQAFPLDWNYYNIVSQYIKESPNLLDMGTGGGEVLTTLEHLPQSTCATEGYPPNLVIAKQRLEPLGIQVYSVADDAMLPFHSEQFDLVINRHGSYDSSEIHRILTPGGIFITQQVGGSNCSELNEWLGAKDSPYVDWTLHNARYELEKTGLNIIFKKNQMTKTRFFDITALVYYIKAIPWQIEDFTVDKYISKLVKIQDKINATGYVDITQHRFMLIAKKEDVKLI